MIKHFFNWHRRKSRIDESKTRLFFHEREVWFASLGVNIGFEQDGKGDHFLRPVVVIKKFNNQVFWGVPTTRKEKEGGYYFRFLYRKTDFTTAILSQLKLIDSKRLRYQVGIVQIKDFDEMKKRLTSFLK